MSKLSLEEIKMGYFILVEGEKNFISNQIKKEQVKRGYSEEDSCFTHVMCSGGERHAVNATFPRLKICDITKDYKGRYVRITAYKNEDYLKKGRYKVAFFAASLNNTRYDFFGVLRFKLSFLFHKKNWWFCSESCAYALGQEYPSALDKKPQDCMPADFTNLDHFDIIWEGRIP